jgi:hypothetical protein
VTLLSTDLTAGNDWLTLLDKAPASWSSSIDANVTRHGVREQLCKANVVHHEGDDTGYSLLSFAAETRNVELHAISFRVPRGYATLGVTASGQLYQAERDENALPRYPHSRHRSVRPLALDIAHDRSRHCCRQS